MVVVSIDFKYHLLGLMYSANMSCKGGASSKSLSDPCWNLAELALSRMLPVTSFVISVFFVVLVTKLNYCRIT